MTKKKPNLTDKRLIITQGSSFPQEQSCYSHPTATTPQWQQALSQCIQSLPELLSFVQLSPEALCKSFDASYAAFLHQAHNQPHNQLHNNHFPLRVPRQFAQKIAPNNPRDPLLLQVLPQPIESQKHPGYGADPLDESHFIAARGFIKKYHGRALLITNGSCAVHCRYCFRRHFPYESQQLTRTQWQQLGEQLQAHPDTKELILSGGDPLTLKTEQLGPLQSIIAQYPQIKRLRIHSRFPVMIPQRIDRAFIDWITTLPIPVIMVFHVNHPREIDQQFAQAIAPLKNQGITLLNQSVLLRGVNDSADTLIALQEKLFSYGVLPYYLHLLDPVQGAHHFDVPEAQGRKLMAEISKKLPGFLMPRLAKEEPGAQSKTYLS